MQSQMMVEGRRWSSIDNQCLVVAMVVVGIVVVFGGWWWCDPSCNTVRS